MRRIVPVGGNAALRTLLSIFFLDIRIGAYYNFFMRTAISKAKELDFRFCRACEKLYTGAKNCPQCQAPFQLVDFSFFLKKQLGKYLVEDLLGAGGMGVVFQAVHQTLKKKVALKIFVPDVIDATYEKRFLREARFLAKLKHPHIVEIFDFDVSPWGTPYYVMEHLEGVTLRREIQQHPDGMPVETAVRFLEQMFRCVSYAHEQGIIHRDLKPENIFLENLRGTRSVKILDFGIAKPIEVDPETGSLTRTSAVLGTPCYVTPEQLLKQKLGPYTDQYALAFTAFEMLSGHMAREGKSVEEIMSKEAYQPLRPRNLDFSRISKAAAHILVKATMPEPSRRFPSVRHFGEALLGALGGEKPAKKEGGEARPRMLATTGFHAPPREGFLSIEAEARLKEKEEKRRKRLWVFLIVLLLLAAVYFFLLR